MDIRIINPCPPDRLAMAGSEVGPEGRVPAVLEDGMGERSGAMVWPTLLVGRHNYSSIYIIQMIFQTRRNGRALNPSGGR
jgi:hypothetical protein